MSILENEPICKHIYKHIFNRIQRRAKIISIAHLRAQTRRTYPPAPKGSLTLEAAIVLPVFMIFVTALLYLLIILSLQANIQLSMEETARSLDKKAYLTNEANLDFVINPLTVKQMVMTPELTDKVNRSHITGGVNGIDTLLTTYNYETGILDIVLSYKYEIPFIFPGVIKFSFVQRCESRAWIGKSIKGEEGAGEESETRTVYITPTGTAYHLTKSCPYLDLSIRMVSGGEVDGLRNKNGGIYYRCTACARSGEYVYVYITDYGTNWHASLSCSGLKRTVTAVDISEVGSRHECSKCGGNDK